MPKALRLLRHATKATRQPAAVLATDPPMMPDGLNAAEQVCWAALMEELATVPGLATRADRGVCELVARLEPMLRKAAAVVRTKGSTLTCVDKDGLVKFVQTRPEATFVLKAAATLKGLYDQLGLSPSGRSRVALVPAAPTSKLDRFLAGRQHGA
jgi:P27 family predicted phage terminase small subunit